MGRQTSQYSLCIYATQSTFYTVSSTFYTVNFLLFTWSTWVFMWSTFSFNRIKFYFIYGQVDFLYDQLLLFTSVSVKADCRFQTADRKPGVKCRLRVKCWLKTADQGKRQTRFKNNPLPRKNFKSELGSRPHKLEIMFRTPRPQMVWALTYCFKVIVWICSLQPANYISLMHIRNKQFCWATLGSFHHTSEISITWTIKTCFSYLCFALRR